MPCRVLGGIPFFGILASVSGLSPIVSLSDAVLGAKIELFTMSDAVYRIKNFLIYLWPQEEPNFFFK
jgi:hypothetical protein